MAIQLECPGCKARLQVDESLAGKQGKCIHCGHRVIVPGGTGSSISTTLFEASPERMMRELGARSQSAVLILLKPTAEGSYDMREMEDADLKCIVTEDINAERFAQVVASVAARFSARRQEATGPDANAPFLYELKGDRLGMSLDEFKRKYARGKEGSHDRLPICSDEAWGANKAALHSEPWHTHAGIVHARIDHPSEDNSPTVGGVKTQLLLYHFLNGQLFRISAFFGTDQFHFVHEAAVEKYGEPSNESQKPRQIVWENPVSSVVLSRGAVHPPKPSTLTLLFKPLAQIAEARAPSGAADI
jgi:hypothetical protein